MRRYFVLLAVLSAAVVLAVRAGRSTTAQTPVERFETACHTSNPYLAVSLLAEPDVGADGPAIIAFRDTAADGPAGNETLATRAQLGTVYGLAYDHTRHQIYAAAYHRADADRPAGERGTVYRVDIASGEVAPLVVLDTSPDAVTEVGDDPAALVGKTGLGDIDIAADGSELYVVNLGDRQVYRIGLPSGEVRGTFLPVDPSIDGAVDMRPMGLGVHDGWVYHGVVNSRESDEPEGGFNAHVYRTEPGTRIREPVLAFGLGYGRSVPWVRWGAGGRGDAPLLSDIDFRPDGTPILGLRDRRADMDPRCVWTPGCAGGLSVGDMVGVQAGTSSVITNPPWYQDTGAGDGAGPNDPDLTWGALAALPGIDLVVAPGRSRQADAADVLGWLDAEWYDNTTGASMRREPLARPTPGADAAALALAPGDIEPLCGPEAGDQPEVRATLTEEAGAIATATAEVRGAARATALVATKTVHAPTAVARETAVRQTATALQPTLEAAAPTRTAAATYAAETATAHAPRLVGLEPTATAVADMARRVAPPPAPTATAYARAYASVTFTCGTHNPFMVTSCFVPMLDGRGNAYGSRWLAAQPVVVAFNDTERDDLTQHLNLAFQDQVGAVFGVAHDLVRDHVYVSAYNKRLAAFGPLGPGGIYRVELPTGIVRPFAALDAGRDPHDFSRSFDESAAALVGRVALGDIEISNDANELYVVNLHDRMIYRLSVPDGRVLGAFPHGAAGEPWAADAQPFGLAVNEGWLYHGVVDSRARQERDDPNEPRPLMAYVYRSRPDGAELQEVARVDLEYGRQPPWQPWLYQHDEGDGRAQPMLTDIEFREDGDLLLGLRDRKGDSRIMIAAAGDMVLTKRLDDRFVALTVPEVYRDNIRHRESSWGTLASMPWLDLVVSTVIDPVTIWSGGAAWFDNISGSVMTRETVYVGRNITYGKAAGLGDLEAMCAPLTPTPTPSPTSGASPTPTVTPRPTSTATITPTPTPYRIYLPFADNEKCVPEEIFTDVVLVLDMSTSMYRTTRGGRTKHEAAIAAARQFVDQLDLEPNLVGASDRVAVVGFNDLAWTQIGLTNDRAAANEALVRLLERVQEGTRLDLALREGQAAIDRGPRVERNRPVMVLLTDGLPNRVPTPVGGGKQEDTVLRWADAAKASGTRVFTIGLGLESDVLSRLLEDAASTPDDYYFAPDGEDLAAIYREVAGRLTECP